ncbi:hypothetical protein E3P99_03154 [Wallemia hederae]|uniref:Uncharacterized protein n=1 Tax=Wallemia hederae TaxID=1540922 RepID=A0A4T0FIR8_9BASI|nr:hypothetical protein E3P99_03154 [Wallemia hederae]
MIILKGDQADFTDRNSRGELVHDEPYLPRYSQQGFDWDSNDSAETGEMTQTSDSQNNLRPLLPIHAPYQNTRDRTTAAPYNPLQSTATTSSRQLPPSENPFAHPDDSQSLLVGPVPSDVAKRRTKKRFFIALAWALSVYVAIGAILGPILEHYLNDKSPNVSNESDSSYRLPYGLSANRSSVSSKLALQGSSELVLLPASGKIDIQLPASVNGKVKVERSPTNETDKDGNPTAPSKETSFWAQFTLPKSVDAVMSKHSESLIAHLLVPLQPLQLVLPLQQPPSSNGSNSTDTTTSGDNDTNSDDSTDNKDDSDSGDGDDDGDNGDDTSNTTTSSNSNQRRRSFEAQPIDVVRQADKPSAPPSKWHRALCPLISPFGGYLPNFLPCTGIHSMRAQMWSSYENEWSRRYIHNKDMNVAATLPSQRSYRRALASDQLNATTRNVSDSNDVGQIEFSPGGDQASEWASLVVESLNQNVTGGLNITVDDPYGNGTSTVDVIPACEDCFADAAITLYLPSDIPPLDLSISTKSKDIGVFVSDLTDVLLDTVRLDLESGNVAVEELNATTSTINTYNGTIFGKFSTNSFLSMGSTTSTNATVSLFDKPSPYAGDAYINAYSSKGNATLSINGTALRDDVYVNADGRKSSQLNLPLDYTGNFGVKAKDAEGVAILNVQNSTKVVRNGVGEIKNADREQDPYDDHIDWVWSTTVS